MMTDIAQASVSDEKNVRNARLTASRYNGTERYSTMKDVLMPCIRCGICVSGSMMKQINM